MANRKRFSLRHSHAYGPDFANSLFISQRLSKSTFLTELQSAQTGTGAVAYRVMLANKGDASLAIGLGPELESSKWTVGTFAAGGSEFAAGTYTDDADQATVTLSAVGSANSGHVVAATEPFSAIRYTTSGVVEAGALDRAWYYWNGTLWVDMTTTHVLKTTVAADVVIPASSTYEVVFQPPAEWVTADSDDITGLNSGNWYCIRMGYKTQPDTAAVAASLKVVHPLRLSVQLADADGEFEYVSTRGIPLTGDGEALWAVQTGTADATLANMKYVTVIGENAGEAGTLGSE